MTNEEKKSVIKFLESFGWYEERCVDVSKFQFGIGDSDMRFIGSKFHMFTKAKEFLQNFGGIELKWKVAENKYNYILRIRGDRTSVRVRHFKWYNIYLNCMLYPIAEYPAMPADLLIDTDGNFFFVNGDYVCEAGNDFLEILNNLLNNRITALGNYYKIPDWEDAGYSDEFIEQWNYDFDILK